MDSRGSAREPGTQRLGQSQQSLDGRALGRKGRSQTKRHLVHAVRGTALVDPGHPGVDGDLDVVIGSRDLERAAAAAAEVGGAGATNADAVRDTALVVLATKAEAALETARELRMAIGEKPVLSVASELRFTAGGVGTPTKIYTVRPDGSQLRRLTEGYTRSSTTARRFRETPVAPRLGDTLRTLGPLVSDPVPRLNETSTQ